MDMMTGGCSVGHSPVSGAEGGMMNELVIGASQSAGSGHLLWVLWGGVGIFLVGIYMAVYVLIRTRWGHRVNTVTAAPEVVDHEVLPLK
jgi:hypothetical protein